MRGALLVALWPIGDGREVPGYADALVSICRAAGGHSRNSRLHQLQQPAGRSFDCSSEQLAAAVLAERAAVHVSPVDRARAPTTGARLHVAYLLVAVLADSFSPAVPLVDGPPPTAPRALFGVVADLVTSLTDWALIGAVASVHLGELAAARTSFQSPSRDAAVGTDARQQPLSKGLGGGRVAHDDSGQLVKFVPVCLYCVAEQPQVLPQRTPSRPGSPLVEAPAGETRRSKP